MPRAKRLPSPCLWRPRRPSVSPCLRENPYFFASAPHLPGLCPRAKRLPSPCLLAAQRPPSAPPRLCGRSRISSPLPRAYAPAFHSKFNIQHSKLGGASRPSAPPRLCGRTRISWCLGGSTPFSIADFGLKSRRARRSRPTGGKSRAGMPVAPCAAAEHCSGARTFSPPRARRAWRGACARPLACGLGSPRSQGKARSARPMRLGLPFASWCLRQRSARQIMQLLLAFPRRAGKCVLGLAAAPPSLVLGRS